ncbi:phage tail sheath subtilisin-like domain-containing protein [Luteibacter aegosomaticola]|uniref:phage tail sheath subtilisin-like domain-containing protein n=1 Tax=Luteibacter aegosomaticola TaxID=2911538 RepID=UPI001FFA53CD|nr:phage tail sheath subtilisin-like domain-containing protein [Luteibacter aegosomaticola]UPG89269.1 phage tail sheath subtilisin-like domain-containing protein [Luteibacter aegosomaticola]
MSVPFSHIPQNLRVPLFYAEVDNSQANSGQQTQRALVIGQITSAGSAVAGQPVISSGASDAIGKGGAGSMLALMTAAYRNSDAFGELWLLPLADAAGAIAASGSIAFSGTPTAAGVLSLYIAASALQPPLSVPVALTDTAASIATSVVAAINAATNLPVTAVVDGTTASKVNLTAKNKGLAGNDIDVRLNYGGTAAGEALPAGVTATIVAMASGATNPTLATALANLGDEGFDFIVCPYSDTASLDALKAFLNDSTGRWSWSEQLYGHVFAANRGTLAAQTTLGTGRNNQHESILGFNDSPTPSWLWAADYAGAAAVALRADPGRPLQTIALNTALAPPVASRYTKSDRNVLLWDGISTFTVAQDGAVALENVITTYQKNAFGQADESYLEVETLFLLMFVLRDMNTLVTSKYARMKLANDGTRFAPGSAIVTPSIIKADLIAEFRTLEYQGFVQGADAFAQGLIVQRNATNPNRIDVLWPGALINQLRIFAVLAQFRLSA